MHEPPSKHQQPAPLPQPLRPPTGHKRKVHDSSQHQQHSRQQQQQTGFASLTRNRQDRRSFSGSTFANMFEGRFRTLRDLHSHTYLGGLNVIGAPGLPTGAIFRASLPTTPVATPIRSEPAIQFTEQAVRNRLFNHTAKPTSSIFSQTPSKFAHLQSSRAKDLDYNDDVGFEMEFDRAPSSTPMEMDSSSPSNG